MSPFGPTICPTSFHAVFVPQNHTRPVSTAIYPSPKFALSGRDNELVTVPNRTILTP